MSLNRRLRKLEERAGGKAAWMPLEITWGGGRVTIGSEEMTPAEYAAYREANAERYEAARRAGQEVFGLCFAPVPERITDEQATDERIADEPSTAGGSAP